MPFVGFWKVFEMPLLGYLGYIPFAMELYAIYQFARGLARATGVTLRRPRASAEWNDADTGGP